MATTSSTSSSTTAAILLSQGLRRGAAIRNTDANILYVLIGPGTASSTNHTVALNQNDYFETPPFYNGEVISGVWAADGSGAAIVTEF